MPAQFPLNEKEDDFNLPHTVGRKRGRKCTPAGLKCIILVNILMYVWAWSKGKIPSETEVGRGGEMVMFIFICPLLGETCALPLTHTWIINARALPKLTSPRLRHAAATLRSHLTLSPPFCRVTRTRARPQSHRLAPAAAEKHTLKECYGRSGLNLCVSAVYWLPNATVV